MLFDGLKVVRLPHWPSITRRIVDSGLTQPAIAKACGCAQASINDVLHGLTKDPRASIALGLMRLAAERGIDVAATAVEAGHGT